MSAWEKDSEFESALEDTSPSFLSQHSMWLRSSLSYTVYLVLVILCACLPFTPVVPASPVVLNHRPLARPNPAPPGYVWECLRHFWLSQLGADTGIQWVETSNLSKSGNSAKLRKSCASLSYGRTGTNPCLQHSAQPYCQGTRAGTQLWDRWMRAYMKIRVSMNFETIILHMTLFEVLPFILPSVSASVINVQAAALPCSREEPGSHTDWDFSSRKCDKGKFLTWPTSWGLELDVLRSLMGRINWIALTSKNIHLM